MSAEPKAAYDVIVVGGGTTGCVVAGRLAEDPGLSVALVEAGSDPLPAEMPEVVRYSRHWLPYDRDFMWSYDAAMLADPPTATEQLRGRVLGGSSAVNGAIALRGLPADYDNWGSSKWSFDAVLPYFKRFERDLDFDGPYHGSSGPIPVQRYPREAWTPLARSFELAAASAGFPAKDDLNSPHGGGYGPLPFSLDNAERNSTASAYLGHRPSNLEVLARHTALSLVMDGNRVEGVLVSGGSGVRTLRAHQVIVSAGVFGSPKLLMLSGIGDPQALASAGIVARVKLPGVGRNLRCHPGFHTTRLPEHARPAESGSSDFHVGLVFGTAGGNLENDLQLLPRQVGPQTSFHVTVRVPESIGSVRLRSSDPDADPIIDYGYLATEDRRRLRNSVAVLDELLHRRELSWVLAAGEDDMHRALRAGERAVDEWLNGHIYAPYHGCGTCRMGDASDPDAVVDEDGRVFGIDGLRVFDGSIMPQSVRGGPYATTMMLGERGADLVASSVGSKAAATH